MKKKTLVLILALVLVIAIGASGTLAYLTGTSETVTNTFAIKGIFEDPDTDLKLFEHEVTGSGNGVYTLGEGEVLAGAYDAIVPGVDLPKDPTLRIMKNTVDIYAFVKVTGWTVDGYALSNEGLTATVDNAVWTALPGVTGVYYITREAPANIAADAGQEYEILAENTVTVPSTLDEAAFEDLTFNAYVIQTTNGNGSEFTAAEAWTALNP